MDWTPATLYRPAGGDRLRCELCPFACELADGETGRCNVRRRRGDRLETATFATSVVHADAVERKPLYHYRPGTMTRTLAAPGCTFRCNYCVNHRMSQYGRSDGFGWTARPVEVDAIIADAAANGACVALSYSEPSLAVELTLALAERGREHGVEIIWKSNGFLTDRATEAVAPALAACNIDVKTADPDRHERLTGAPLAPVPATVRRLRDLGVWVEIATPLIPGFASDPGDVRRVADLIAGIDPAIPWHLLRFTPTYRMRHHDPTAPAALAEAAAIGRDAGLRHVYVERALGAAGRSTYCPSCARPVIERGVYGVTGNLLIAGACPHCGTRVEGRW